MLWGRVPACTLSHAVCVESRCSARTSADHSGTPPLQGGTARAVVVVQDCDRTPWSFARPERRLQRWRRACAGTRRWGTRMRQRACPRSWMAQVERLQKVYACSILRRACTEVRGAIEVQRKYRRGLSVNWIRQGPGEECLLTRVTMGQGAVLIRQGGATTRCS